MTSKNLKILLVTPADPKSPSGNGMTADRWSRILRQLGHSVEVALAADLAQEYEYDLLVALHAKRQGLQRTQDEE